MSNVLIIDDDITVCSMLSDLIGYIGHESKIAHTLKDGLDALLTPFDVVFLDVRLPDGNGLESLQKILETNNPPEIIIITGAGDPDGAELAMKNGVWDYIQKPLSPQNILLPIKRVLQYRKGLKSAKTEPVLLKRERIIGNSKALSSCLDLVAKAAAIDSNVLITGETGVGKELFARAIHENSFRSKEKMVVVDCAVMPDTLFSATLLGHEKGAFTGADKQYDGLLKLADRGTLFLDEVGELSPLSQKALLRVLQERRFCPLGGKNEITTNFRLIAATNRNLDKMVQDGLFRNDLLYRIRTMTIHLPPLRERKEDIQELVLYHTNKLCQQYAAASKGFVPEFWDMLASYDWAGNVRELINVVEAVFSSARNEPTIFPKHLPANIRIEAARKLFNGNTTNIEEPQNKDSFAQNSSQSLKDLLEETEREYLKNLLSSHENKKEICRISGLSRTRLYERLKKYNLI